MESPPADPRTRSIRRVLSFVLLGNVLLSLTKGAAGVLSGSIAILADAAQSAVDATASAVSLVLISYSSRPPDPDHPYGHSRFEVVGAFALAGLLFLTAFEVFRESLLRILGTPPPLREVGPSFLLVVLALLGNLSIVFYERASARRLSSPLLLVDSAHSLGDALATLAALASLGFSRAGYSWIDPIVGLGIGTLVGYTGYRVFRAVVPILTDRAPHDAYAIAKVVLGVPGVVSVHDIKSRGPREDSFIQMHLVVSPSTVEQAHAVTEEVERRLAEAFGAREVLVHLEPSEDAPLTPGALERTERDPKEPRGA